MSQRGEVSLQLRILLGKLINLNFGAKDLEIAWVTFALGVK